MYIVIYHLLSAFGVLFKNNLFPPTHELQALKQRQYPLPLPGVEKEILYLVYLYLLLSVPHPYVLCGY